MITVTSTTVETPAPVRRMAILGFVLSFFGVLDVAGMILCIVAFRRARQTGGRHALALAGIIIAAFGILVTALVAFMVVGAAANIAHECQLLGPGSHHVGSVVYSCS